MLTHPLTCLCNYDIVMHNYTNRSICWRTSHGSEVDFIVEHGEKLIPIEAKLSATPRPTMAPGILAFRKDFPKKAEKGYIIHPGDMKLSISPNVLALPFAGL
jgi:predicted AAA+ superfamily ATPase